jgi:hypothetical protein
MANNARNIPCVLGTGFFIAEQGLILTAKHCLTDNKGTFFKSLHIVQFPESNSSFVRPIFKHYSNYSDLAVLLPNHAISKKTGLPLRNPSLAITAKRPKTGETISSYAFPKTDISFNGNSCDIEIADTWHSGIIKDFHPQGFSILKNSCFQSSMQILHFSSGEPVLNSEGRVFAINLTGSNVIDGLNPYSFFNPH